MGGMSSAQIQEHASSAAQEELGRVHSPQASSTVTPALQMQKQQHDAQHRQANDEYVMVDSWGSPSPKKKRRRTESVEAECDLEENEVAAGAEQQKSTAEEKKEEKGEDAEENGRMNEEKETAQDQADAREVVANGSAKEGQVVDDGQVSGDEKQPESEGVDAVEKQQEVGDEPNVEDAARSGQAQSTSSTPVRVPSPAVHISGVDMVFPEDEVPIELCPFSSDGSVDPPHLESPPRRSNSTEEAPHEAPAATVTTPAAAPVVDTAPSTPASVTAEESTVPTAVNSTTGRRKRRKKLIYSVPRSKATTGAKQEQKSAPVSPLLEEKLSIAVNGHEAEIGVAGDSDGSAPPSPVYPDADASHLYPSTPEGEPWRWEDVDPYFDPLAQNDLDNLVRWRKENADFIAANPYEWRGKSGMESKRAVLEAMLADASDASTAHVEFPVRRGRNYRGVWEETDFLEQQKRDISTGESNLKSQVVNMKKKRKGGDVDAEGSLLESHRDLVYGYDDDLFQDFMHRLENRVKACQSNSPPSTPPTPPMRRQHSANAKADETVSDATEQKAVFDEEVLPSFPIHQLHPASLGLWKLRKNQEPDYTVVHPASVNRSQARARWKEEMKQHHKQQYELQLQRTDEFGDPSDGDDEGTGDDALDLLRATISNSEVTGGLPSFGDCVEEDEISQALAASMSKLIPLSIYNWRTAQLVLERAACSIQCAPILEGEAAAARELEGVFLQLCPPEDTNVHVDVAVLPGSGPTRQPRPSQINSVPHDLIAYSLRHDIADNCSLAVAASVEFALGLGVGDVVDVLDRNGCWNYGEIVEIYSEDKMGLAKFVLLRFSLWSEDTVEWIAASEGRILPRGVADGTRPCSVGPTRAHRARVSYDQSLARELERSFPQRQAKQSTAVSNMLVRRQHNVVIPSSIDQQKTPQKRKRKRPAKSTTVTPPQT
ncbi:hypothetical protein PF005_g17475 [Phytophthora fragariae]|uniref:Uncharacterized protein n=2 Tax=Phytophthora fragariae TaxID=53985 RepID=A0A6A4CZE0_9STRA|nr:hypothetical protein PF009_g3609 [Phytophthora fragariae]KAE9094820.1 hypothetical protein PF007_g17622 [Phytophthora fragariae]KAE9194959.1 hypothetical protein PF005_g17475 [Phytophthora fragariae]KAE9238598.1 hypothetical protein PF004_g8284 [Phytophthora fragariae]KAE9297764.1 hypothetical protein PF001_g16246 [Phytophthora fragariae]